MSSVGKQVMKSKVVPIGNARSLISPDIGDPPVPPVGAPLSHYKGTSLKNVGRDKNGKNIPHKRSEVVAQKIAKWVAGGYNENDIAVHLNIRPGLLRQEYGKELRHGAEAVGMEMTEHIIDQAKKSDHMAIFYAKSRMGWDGNANPDSDKNLPAAPVHVQVIFVSPNSA